MVFLVFVFSLFCWLSDSDLILGLRYGGLDFGLNEWRESIVGFVSLVWI